MILNPPKPRRRRRASAEPVRVPRPGHADLGGALLYDLRRHARRHRARQRPRDGGARSPAAPSPSSLLASVGCRVVSHVVAVGGGARRGAPLRLEDVARVEADPLRCADAAASARMRAAIDAAPAAGDTLGGVVEVLAFGYPPRRRQLRTGRSPPAGGAGRRRLHHAGHQGRGVRPRLRRCGAARQRRPRRPRARRRARATCAAATTAGGIEGGISTGDTIVLRAAMKPIATLRSPLPSVEMGTHRAVESRFERSDVCAVPAAGVVLEAVRRAGPGRRGAGALRRRHGRRSSAPPWTPIARTTCSGERQPRRTAGAPVPAVALVGFMARRQERRGQAVAQRLRFAFVDTDALIEQRDGPIAEIFAGRGEHGFRAPRARRRRGRARRARFASRASSRWEAARC